MASYARRFIAAGVRLVGGCCGTTPEHIRQIAAGGATSAPAARARRRAPARRRSAEPLPAVARAREVGAGARARRRPVRRRRGGVGAARRRSGGAVAQARRFRELGAVAVNVPDCPKSGARASALALGVLVEQQGRVETLLHYSLPRPQR